MLIRLSDTTGDLAHLRPASPHRVRLAEPVRVAGLRWPIEESFPATKGLTG